jgi:hypothetical protein
MLGLLGDYGSDSDNDTGPNSPSLTEKIAAAATAEAVEVAATVVAPATDVGGSSDADTQAAPLAEANAGIESASSSMVEAEVLREESALLKARYPNFVARDCTEFRDNLVKVVAAQKGKTDLSTTILEAPEYSNPEALQWVVDYFGINDSGSLFDPAVYTPNFSESETVSALELAARRFYEGKNRSGMSGSSSSSSISRLSPPYRGQFSTGAVPAESEGGATSSSSGRSGRWGAAIATAMQPAVPGTLPKATHAPGISNESRGGSTSGGVASQHSDSLAAAKGAAVELAARAKAAAALAGKVRAGADHSKGSGGSGVPAVAPSSNGGNQAPSGAPAAGYVYRGSAPSSKRPRLD